MISTARTETETRRYDTANAITPRTDTKTRYVFSGSGRLSICRGAIELSDPYDQTNRTTVTVWFDGDEVVSAIVDWMASLQHGALNESGQHSRNTCRETLSRIAGAMGLDYDASLPADQSAPVAE